MATQTGSIDLTTSNSVKLAAEAGWQSDLEDYYTKSEIDVTVNGINSTVSTKVGEDEVISSINQSAESVSINADKINLQGAVTISDLASDAQSATLNSNISVGGRNWLLDTGTFDNWYHSSVVTASDGITTFPSRSSLSWIYIRHLTIPAADFFGNTWTFSFDYRSDDFSDTSGNRFIDVVLEAGATYNASNRTKYRMVNSPYVSGARDTWVPTTEWQRGSVTFTADESFLSGGSGDVNYIGITIWSYTLNSFQVRHMKLEKGNKPTDWSPAPEDVDSAISDAAKTATSYVTEITGQNGIMVHPSTDDDTGVRITSDVDILRNGYSVINVGTQGDTSGNTDAGVTIYDGTTNENVVATFDGDGIGLVGGAFRLTSERVTEEYGDENNPTTMTEIRSVMKSEGSNDDYETRCFLRSMVGEDDDAYYNTIELTSETDIKTQSPTETNNASVEVGSDQWGSSVRLVADSQELHLHKHPIDGKDYFDLHSEVFLMADSHNGVNMWSTAPGTVLWSGGWHMTAGHTANLKYNVSTCHTGIVLHFQPYTNSTIRNWNHIYYFVPKEHVASYNGSGIVVRLGNPDFSNLASKYLYISNDHITGNDQNNTSGTNSGITYNNAAWVMTQVIAV